MPFVYNWFKNLFASFRIWSYRAVSFIFFLLFSAFSHAENYGNSRQFMILPLLTLTPSDYNGFNISCNAGTDGAIDLTIAGGIQPYQVLWSNGSTVEDISNLAAGNYMVRVIDANQDTVESAIYLIEPGIISIAIENVINVSCFGANNGSVEISVSGGAGIFSYIWSNGATTEDINSITAANYTVTATDVNGCTQSISQNITEPTDLQIAVNSFTNVSCFGGNNGAIDVDASGGTAGYTFLWSNGNTTEDLTNLIAGTYTVTVTDANSCSKSISQEITEPTDLQIAINSFTNVSCFGGNNGAIDIDASGGTAGYTFLWSNGNTTEDLTNLIAGTYTVTVTDANSCSKSISQEITEPTDLQIAINSFTNVSCFGGNNGAIDVDASGGITGYTFLWSNGTTTEDLTNLIAGTYTVIVTEANSCSKSISQNIGEPGEIFVTVDITNNVLCFGGNNGFIELNVTGGTPGYTFLWSNGNTTEDINNLTAGNYSCIVTDANSCSVTFSRDITEPSEIFVTIDITGNVSCFGGSNGFIALNVSGGTQNYSYNWSNGNTTENISNLIAGNYSVTITDANNCTNTLARNITEPDELTISTNTINNVSCFGGTNGSISITVNGGTQNYSYNWSNGSTIEDISNLASANYTLTVTDANNCTATTSQLLSEPTALTVSVNSVTNVTCFNGNSGAIDISASGATPGYSYLWSTGATTEDINNLLTGNYTVTVTDLNGCTSSLTQFISQANTIVAVFNNITNASCFGGANGALGLSVFGGTPGYSYLWSDGNTTEDISNLSAGSYTVTITDASNCVKIISQSISEPSELSASITNFSNVSCFNGNNGGIDLSVSGGTAGYSFLWSNGNTTEDISNLSSGNYTVTITDANNCSQTVSQFVSQPAVLSASITNFNNVSCFNGNNAAIDISVSGGTPGYSYLWSNGSTTEDINNLGAGNYSVTVSDAHSCTQSISQNITEPTQLNVGLDNAGNVSCFGGSNGSLSINVNGGTTGYSFLWSSGNTTEDINNLTTGNYTVTVTDANGCTASLTHFIAQANVIVAVFNTITNVSCFGGNNGTLGTSVFGGTPGYSFLWSTGSTTQNISSLTSANYTVTVSDANGCSQTIAQLISQPDDIAITINNIINEICFGGNNGTIDISATGGSGNYSYQWSTGNTNQDVSNLPAGNYTVTITDANSCTQSTSAVITQPDQLQISFTAQNETCGNANGAATTIINGGVLPYGYLWSNGATTQNLTNIAAGSYILTVTDNNNCVRLAGTTINNIAGPITNIAAIVDVSCYGGNDGSINLSVTNGTIPFSFVWSNGATTEDLNNLPTGTYTVTVTDANTCSSSTGEFVDQADSMSIGLNIIPAFGGPNGTVISTVTGGTPSYSYLWSNGATTTTITGLLPGIYSLTVTDNNSCVSTKSGNVTAVACSLIVDSVKNVSCFGGNDGGVFISVPGAIAPVVYLWSNLALTEDITNLSAATYSVTVTDLFGCLVTTSVQVTEPADLTIGFTKTNETCTNSNGSITANVSGGTGLYSYVWSNAQTTVSITNLSAGTYTVTVTDENGCSKTQSTAITNAAGPVLSLDSAVNVKCFGQTNGGIYVLTTGGTPAINYLWSTAATTEDLSNIASGTYSVTATDANSCTASLSQIINQPVQLDATLTFQNETCGNANGTLTATPSGGTTNYSYLWSNAQTTQTASGLIAGTYTVTVTDANGCSVNKTQAILNEGGPVLTTDSVRNVSCFSQSNGAVFISFTGGTAPVSFLWSNAATTQNIINVVAGTYTVTATDDNGCTASASATVNQPVVLNGSTNSANATCGSANGTATVTPTGGTIPYTYVWSDAQTTQTATNLAAGTYTVTVTDANSCTIVKTQTVLNTSSPVISIDSIRNVKCFGNATGALFISITGGSPGFTFAWSNGSTTEDLTNVLAGNYSLIVTDNIGCGDTIAATITQPLQLSDSTTTTSTLCGNSTGTAKVWPYDGTSPYTFIWSTTATTQQITGLTSGAYTVTVTDANNCTTSSVAVVANIAGPTITVDTVIHVLCNGQTNGAIQITVSGGTPAYLYNWSNGATTDDISTIPAGSYTVIVRDANNCLSTLTIPVTQPLLLNDSIQKTNEICGHTDGSAIIFPFGGTSPYTFLWSTTATTQSISGLSAGTYTVTVTDNHVCTESSTVTILNTAGPSIATDSIRSVKCNGNSNGALFIKVTGGSPPYSYSWSPGGFITEDITGIAAGNYTVIVTDTNNCTATSTLNVPQPALLTDSVSTTNTTCTSSNGTATALPAGGVQPYTYVWSGGQTTNPITGLTSGIYTVTVTDANNCTVVTSASVNSTGGAAIVTDSVKNVTCNGLNNGAIYINLTGGTPNFTYVWSNGQSTQDISALAPGNYTVNVFDANNCLSSKSFIITQPLVLNDSITSINETCTSGNGSLTAFPFGGTLPYTFLWSTTATTQSISNLAAGNYSVTVTDSNGCTKTDVKTILNFAAPELSIDSVKNVRCNGEANGAAFISILGGISPVSYQWTPGGFNTQDISGLNIGTYQLIATDSNTCKDSISVTISQPAVLNDSIIVTNATCASSNGSATVFPFGGNGTYSYLWSQSSTVQTITNAAAGTYTVTITDILGCSHIDSVTISNINGPTLQLDSVVNVKCNGGSDGAIYVSVTNGTLPYTYLWSNAATTKDITNLPANTYTITVTDFNNCTVSDFYSVAQPTVLNDSIAVTDATCGHSDGALTVNPFGGTGPYTYLWSSAANDTTQTISNLLAATYTVTVTDANGCTIVSSATISNLPGPSVSIDSVYNTTCFGGNNGAVFITASGGNPTYSYFWSFNGQVTEDLTGIGAGSYTVTVTDTNLCTTTDSAIVTQPTAVSDSILVTNASCNTANGVATVYPFGGNGPYTYVWSTTDTTATIDSLAAASYTVIITDANNCTANDVANISNIGGPSVIIDSVKNVSCFNGTDGMLLVTTSSGSLPYQFAWSNAQTTEDITNLTAGTYTLTVTDSANCIVIVSQQITQPDAILLSLNSSPASCGLANGSAGVIATGGTGTYNYVWSNGQTTQTISNLFAGTYTVTVKDGNNCEADTFAVVINPSSPVISNTAVTDVKCFNGSDGSVDISVNGGTLPYSFVWSNTLPVVITEDLTNAVAGNYTITITDSANCSTSQSFTINQPTDIQIDFSIVNPTCNASNGSVISDVNGGAGNYTYQWSNAETTQGIFNLSAGGYTLTVTDGNLCTKTSIASLGNISAPTVTVQDSGMVSCNGSNDGFINVVVTGGVQPYNYSWSNTTQTTPFISNLAGNTFYTLTLTDSNNCIAVRTVFISEPDSIVILDSISQPNGIYNISCFGGNDGSITLFPTGGTAPYTYIWSNASLNQQITGLIAGNYTVTVTDAHTCSRTATISVIEPPELISIAGSNFIICGIDYDTLRANEPLYGTGYWEVASGSATIEFPDSAVTPVSGLGVGNNVLKWKVTDGICIDSSQVIITVNTAITAIAGADRAVCIDSITLTATPPQFGSGFWATIGTGGNIVNPNQAQTPVINLTSGINTFQWTVTNGNCVDSALVIITLRNPAECLTDIELPNGITPNGDGKNDIFNIKGLSEYAENTIVIYNRWGNKVYEATPYLNSWTGVNQSGNPLPDGTYFVILKIKSIDKIFTGYIDLRR